MKKISRISFCIPLLFALPAGAQYNGEIEIPENVLEAIREFNERPPGTPNEIIVVLDPPTDAEEPPPDDGPDGGHEGEIDDVVASILENVEVVEEKDVEIVDGTVQVVEALPGESPTQGPEVRVQRLRDLGRANIQSSDVRISTPFAAKPLGTPTPGWKLVSSPDAPAYTQSVEVAPGTSVTLSIRPHVLIPDADGRTAFQIQEPGFDPALGYAQRSTVSASLASSIRQLEEDASILAHAIDELEQILISLPKSDN